MSARLRRHAFCEIRTLERFAVARFMSTFCQRYLNRSSNCELRPARSGGRWPGGEAVALCTDGSHRPGTRRYVGSVLSTSRRRDCAETAQPIPVDR
jgi:hypothetical protein